MMSSDQTVRVVIPARYGSTRLPGKPLVDLGGKPMLARVYEAAHAALPGADAIVAIDDERVMEVMELHGIPAVMTNPQHDSGLDRVAEVARLRGWGDEDIVINIQGDEPLVPPDLLRAFMSFCQTRGAFSMATISVPIDSADHIHDPNVVKLLVDEAGDAIVFSRAPIPFDREGRHDVGNPSNYLRHVGIYAYRNCVVQRVTHAPTCMLERVEKLEQLRALWLGIPIHVFSWCQSPPHGVDTPEDAVRVAAIFKEARHDS